jgi:hypothetical protein
MGRRSVESSTGQPMSPFNLFWARTDSIMLADDCFLHFLTFAFGFAIEDTL